MNNDIRPLCICFRHPPEVRPQAILIGKMIPEWIKQGLKPVVVTYKSEGKWDIDAPVYYLPTCKTNRLYAILPFLSKFIWQRHYKKTFEAIRKIIERHNCNIVFSFSNPQDSNIVGAMLKEKTGIKFVSHFSDPWYDNFYSEFRDEKILKKEEHIIKNSDRIIFITEETKQLVMKKYPREYLGKTEIIPHCYDLKDYPEAQKDSSRGFTISYIGAFYEQRNPELLFKALCKLKQRRIDLEFKIQLVGCANPYAGYSEEKIINMAEKYDLKNNIKIIPVVAYKESLKLMKESDCLVVIDADAKDSPFLTSKVVDYAGSGTVIIGITPDNSPTAQFLTYLGYKSFNYGQTDELSAYLEKLLSGQTKIMTNTEYLKQYDVSATTAKLIDIFKEIILQ